MKRYEIIINHKRFCVPLQAALTDVGLLSLGENWIPTKQYLENTCACLIDFYDVMRYPLKTYRLKKRLNKYNIPLIAWNRDAPHYLNKKTWRLDLFNRIKLLDIYATHTLINSSRTFADTVLYLPNAADIERYHLYGNEKTIFTHLRDPLNYRYDVSFFGGMDGSRYKEDIDREIFFSSLSKELDKKDIRYNFIETGANNLSVDQQIKIIQSSVININYGARCEYGAPVASGLPERCFGIPASGGFLLCDKRTHTKDTFIVGKHMDEFNDLPECVSKIEYYIKHFNQARDIAENGYHHVVQNHTYRNRAIKLHDYILLWENKKTKK
jgi:spore maturation protein CgeB|tara:strand:- start:122 stop:1099 length:978 start_codon:yes stop_codon:yes gene_type:complete